MLAIAFECKTFCSDHCFNWVHGKYLEPGVKIGYKSEWNGLAILAF